MKKKKDYERKNVICIKKRKIYPNKIKLRQLVVRRNVFPTILFFVNFPDN